MQTDDLAMWPVTVRHGAHAIPLGPEALGYLTRTSDGYAFVPTSESASQNLIGTWRLHTLESLGDDGLVRYPLGMDAVGYLIYSADGYMSAHLMRPGRAGFQGGDVLRPTPDESVEAIEGYLSYSGTYELRASGVVIHHVELSLARI